MLITAEERGWYVEDILELLQSTEAELETEGGLCMQADDLNSIVHKLLHAFTCIVLGRQHIHHLKRCNRASRAVTGQAVVLGSMAKQKLVARAAAQTRQRGRSHGQQTELPDAWARDARAVLRCVPRAQVAAH